MAGGSVWAPGTSDTHRNRSPRWEEAGWPLPRPPPLCASTSVLPCVPAGASSEPSAAPSLTAWGVSLEPEPAHQSWGGAEALHMPVGMQAEPSLGPPWECWWVRRHRGQRFSEQPGIQARAQAPPPQDGAQAGPRGAPAQPGTLFLRSQAQGRAAGAHGSSRRTQRTSLPAQPCGRRQPSRPDDSLPDLEFCFHCWGSDPGPPSCWARAAPHLAHAPLFSCSLEAVGRSAPQSSCFFDQGLSVASTSFLLLVAEGSPHDGEGGEGRLPSARLPPCCGHSSSRPAQSGGLSSR